MALTDDARRVLINATRGEQIVDACRLSHPSVAEDLYITPYHPGFTFQGNDYIYIPMNVERPSTIDNLSQQFKIVIQDLNEEAGAYLDRIPVDTSEIVTFEVISILISADDTMALADGPYSVQVVEFVSEPQGVGFSAEPQSTNETRCGERGTIERTNGLYRQFT